MKWHLNSSGEIAVSDDFVWQPIETCPIGVKCLLLGGGGVVIVGNVYRGHKWFTHWAPLPRHDRRKDQSVVEHERRMEIYEAFKDE